MALVGVAPAGNFRNVFLNISGIRINQIANASPSDQGWVSLPVPSGSGNGSGASPGDLQIDLLTSQTGAVFYNVGGAPPGTYASVQVLVDPNIPGTIVPACQSGASNTEGCTNYPIQQFNPGIPVIFTLSSPLFVSGSSTAPLVIQLAVSIETTPANSGDPYLVDITASETNAGSFLASVTGNLTVKGSTGTAHSSALSVSAELSGTNNIIETVPVRKKGVYTLELPAAPGGTSYDIFTSGGGDSFTALQNITVTPGQFLPDQNLTVSGVSTTAFAGLIADGCTSSGIPGAQLQLLVPAMNAPDLPSPQPTPPALSFCLTNPEQCVAVATASTDQTGNYPMPGTTKLPTSFAQVPVNQAGFAVRVMASGYSSLLSDAFLKAKRNQFCSAATSSTACNFSLTTGYINGTVNLVSDPPPGNSVVVQVFGENSGTNQLISALPQPLVFINHQTSLPFTLNVPITGAGPNFDLFAVAIDPFLGGSAPFPGHDIPVLADIAGPTVACASIPPIPPSPAATPTPIAFAPMDCVGHGSISGTVQNPDTNTTIEVQKNDPNKMLPVQITGTSPGLLSSVNPINTQYTLCVPPDNYTLQRFEAVPTSSSTTSPTPIPIGTPQPITVPQPAATSSPCPSSCSNSNSGPGPCPGLCNATAASPL